MVVRKRVYPNSESEEIMKCTCLGTYTRNTYKWVNGNKEKTGTCDYTVIRCKDDIVDFYYISDTDNVNHGTMTLTEFVRELTGP